MTERIVEFLFGIGLNVKMAPIEGRAILPGITIEDGVVIVDEAALKHPGDLLHEAGHVALTPPPDRPSLNLNAGDDPGEEMAAIAWSYAAALHLGLDPAVVFHADGYRGGSESILENFADGHTFGVPVLQWLGMAARDDDDGMPPYPRMIKWVREDH